MLALARNIPQAHAALVDGALGALEVRRASRCTRRRSACSASAASASSSPPARRGFGMQRGRLRPVRRRRALPRARRRAGRVLATTCTRQADFITIHLPKTPETEGLLDAEALAKCKDGVRIINCARGDAARRRGPEGRAGLRQGRRRRARRVPPEPITDHPLFGYPNVVVTPHLGASTTEAQDRAGVQTAEQVVAALTGGVVSTAVNIPAVSRGGHGGARPVPAALPRGSAGWRSALARGAERRARRGRVPRPDRRARHAPAHARRAQRRARRPHRGGGQPRQRAGAGRGARDRGLRAQGASPRATSPTSCGSRSCPAASACASSARRSAGAPPAPARGLGPALQPAARRRAPRAVPLLRRARHGRPRRHRARRARHQHLRRRGRPPAPGEDGAATRSR